MNTQEFEILKSDYLLGKLDDKQEAAMEAFLTENPKLIQELDQLGAMLEFNDLELPEATETRMDTRFYEFLKQEKAKNEPKSSSWMTGVMALLSANRWQGKIGYGLVILALGFLVGKSFNPIPTTGSDATNFAIAETEKVRSQLVLELIEQPSANKRLKAVNEASKLNDATEQVIKALFITLNNDDNVNVRLAAIESLMRYSDKPIVRQGLIKSITSQDSPMVQVALADVMVSLQDKNSIDPLKELLEQPDVNSAVRQKIDATIKEII